MNNRIFICKQGSVLDLEEIYCVSPPIEGYGEYKGQWRFKAVAKLDGKPLEFLYEDFDKCWEDQQRLATQLAAYKIGKEKKKKTFFFTDIGSSVIDVTNLVSVSAYAGTRDRSPYLELNLELETGLRNIILEYSDTLAAQTDREMLGDLLNES